MNAFTRIILMLKLALRARRAKRAPDGSGVVGLIGRAETAIAPYGFVFVRGELWPARARANVSRGDRVRIIGVGHLNLHIEKAVDG